MYDLKWYNGQPFEYKDGFISDLSGYMVGMPRFRQLRVKEGSNSFPVKWIVNCGNTNEMKMWPSQCNRNSRWSPEKLFFWLLRSCLNCDSTAMVTSSFQFSSISGILQMREAGWLSHEWLFTDIQPSRVHCSILGTTDFLAPSPDFFTKSKKKPFCCFLFYFLTIIIFFPSRDLRGGTRAHKSAGNGA